MTATNDKALVLVTGASGYIAGHVVRELLEAGYRVRGTVRSLANEKKTAHLRALSKANGDRLELVEADLEKDAGWKEAVAGCTYVQHVASPFPASSPDDENVLVKPAVEGTRRLLEAAASAGTVHRVVLTSSVAAVAYGHETTAGHVFTEDDWSVPERCTPYPKSKTLAERFAWDFVAKLPAERRFELAVINPGFVAGPLAGPEISTSGEVVRRLLIRDMPACPEMGWAVVDVRDVAVAHLLAMERPEAAGNRFIIASEHMWMQDVGKLLAAEFGPLGYRVPTGRLPYWLLWLIARFDKTVRLALEFVGRREDVSHVKATRLLGWKPRPASETFVEMAHSMIEKGVVGAAR